MPNPPEHKPRPKQSIKPKEEPDGIEGVLSTCPQPIQQFVAALVAENLRLQKRIAKLEVDSISTKNRMVALEELKPEAALRNLTDAELNERLERKATQLGYAKKADT